MPVVPSQAKQVTKTIREHAATVRKWLAIEDETLEVLTSLAEFAKRLPLADRARHDPRFSGVLIDDDEGMKGLVLKHVREQLDLAAVLEQTVPSFEKVVDDLEKTLEKLLMLVEQEGWDPSRRYGASPMSPCEAVTWTRQITVMFIDETWRKRVLLEAVASAAQRDEDERTAIVAKDAVRLWRCDTKESFVDAEFLVRFMDIFSHE